MESINMSDENPDKPQSKLENNKLPILIAEDDLTARNILTGVTKNWGYDPIVVNDGNAAWDILQKPDSPRLVIMDWVMPEMEGPEVRMKSSQFSLALNQVQMIT